ncbi:Signal peptidase IB [Streptococcus constellatus]|uniref:Signal peptidase I n=1 Tax=Streptococcus constellatus TaxID=76860 RepID=A0A564SLF1_STRCV|nr:signal peptidase I [Streptococcus constellatus]VUW95901.1 Signal peptidase IB [Streptococcus constellatus]VUX05745.1 Signal peptidase IB [Streptococcus gordonii]
MVKRDLIRNVIFLSIIVVTIVCLRIFIFTPYSITAKDANHFLQDKDVVVANKNEKIKRDDFVLYEADGKEYVGRVIGLGNDSVVYMDDVLYLNNKIKSEDYLTKDKEKYLAKANNTGYFTHDFTIQTLTKSNTNKIPTQSYLILNDNRQNTEDSRKFGLIAEKQIKGVISFRVLPLNQFGFIKTK